MAETFTFPWRYKGSRDYLHGTDMHDFACDALAAAGYTDLQPVELTMHRIARESLRGELVPATGAVPREAPAVFRFASHGQKYALGFLPEGRPVERRDPYAEEEIVNASRVDEGGKRIELSALPGFSNIEMIVAMNKALLQRLFPDAGGKWLFTNLKLERSIRDRQLPELRLQFETHFDLALTRTLIKAGEETLGRIFFSLARDRSA